jgi:hypothetical protein
MIESYPDPYSFKSGSLRGEAELRGDPFSGGISSQSGVITAPVDMSFNKGTFKYSKDFKQWNGIEHSIGRKVFKNQMDMARYNLYAGKSSFLSDHDDGGKMEFKHVETIEKKNPESWILGKGIDNDADAKIKDTNSIAKKWYEDTGAATFEYNPPDDDNVESVQESLQNYARRRDRYFTAPQVNPEANADKLIAYFNSIGQLRGNQRQPKKF